MLARPAIRSVLTRRFTRWVPPPLVWLDVALTKVTLPPCVQRRRRLGGTSEVIASEAGREFKWMRLR